MKRLILFLATTFCSLIANGQNTNDSKPTKDFKRILIGVNFSPDYCFRKLKNNDGSSTSALIVDNRNSHESAKFGYTTGINVCINFSKAIGLEAGIQYSNKGYQFKFNNSTFDPSIPTKGKIIYNDKYIDIPLKINLTLGKRKVQFFSSVGITTNIFIGETQTNILKYSDGNTDKRTQSTPYNYNKVDISPIISLGINYKINDKMNLRVEPTFRYGVLKIIDSPVTGYLWNAGLNIGYYFGL
jgi:hypothetical protein